MILLPDNENVTIDKLYPDHAKALKMAGLISSSFKFPTLKDSLEKIKKSTQANVKKKSTPELITKYAKKYRDTARKTWFCIGYSKFWGIPAGKRINKLCKDYNMSWLRVNISYSTFQNLGQKFNADANNKLMKDIYAQGYQNTNCVCSEKSKMDDGKCQYEGFCQRSTLIYELLCLKTGKSYVGKTQKYLRVRTQQHSTSVWKLIEWKRKVNRGDIDPGEKKKFNVTAASKHFAKFCKDCTNSNQVRQMMKKLMSPRVIWQGDRISCMKTARTLKCKLCMVERREIMHRMKKTENYV